jgi:hypothetical protein
VPAPIQKAQPVLSEKPIQVAKPVSSEVSNRAVGTPTFNKGIGNVIPKPAWKPEPRAPVIVQQPTPVVKREVVPAPLIKAKQQPVEPQIWAEAPEEKATKQHGGWGSKPDDRMSDFDRNTEVERLEAIASEQYGKTYAPKPVREASNFFSIFAGLLFIGNAILFGYFIYPQSLFIINYIGKTGIATFMLSWNYEYDISFINLLFMIFTAISGLLMIAKVRQSHFISGIIGASMILAVTFEYLNSGAAYLLMVSVSSFICIGALAYSRMSAVTQNERDEMPQNVVWPRIETF